MHLQIRNLSTRTQGTDVALLQCALGRLGYTILEDELASQAFEGLGIDTQWEFRMPRAANLFDYSTIADVLLTIEYTALNSFDYRQQVIQTLRPTVSANRRSASATSSPTSGTTCITPTRPPHPWSCASAPAATTSRQTSTR